VSWQNQTASERLAAAAGRLASACFLVRHRTADSLRLESCQQSCAHNREVLGPATPFALPSFRIRTSPQEGVFPSRERLHSPCSARSPCGPEPSDAGGEDCRASQTGAP